MSTALATLCDDGKINLRMDSNIRKLRAFHWSIRGHVVQRGLEQTRQNMGTGSRTYLRQSPSSPTGPSKKP